MAKKGSDEAWRGHDCVTSARLLDVLTTACTGTRAVPRAHKVLFTACEFWAAARNGVLYELLGEDPSAQLASAEAAFIVIGLPQAAACLRQGRLGLAGAATPFDMRRLAATIERLLCAVNEPVDACIAQYAEEMTQPP